MKFELIEKFDETRSIVQDYLYDAIDELNNAPLEEYIQWFKDNLTAYPEDIEQAVTDAYIEACDYDMIKGVEKTRITSELKEYIESHTDIIDDTYELMKQCPRHLQHELKIVLSKLDESLNEELLTEGPRGQTDLRKFICELLNQVCKTVLNFNDFMIHHKDGDHDNNHPKNIVLLPVGTRAVRTTGAVATNKHGKILTNPNSSIHKYITNNSSGVVQSTDHPEYINIINNYNAIDVWRSLQKHNLVYLDDKLLKRDLNKSLKNPTGRIK